MDSFIDRIKAEKNELNEKLEKLTSFINSEKFGSLTLDHRSLLISQKNIMEKYSKILEERLSKL